jgi:ATP synthase protein I
MSLPDHSNKNRNPDLLNWALLGLIGQVGCVTFVIVLLVIFFGLWLDGQFGTRPLFTMILVLSSIPVSIFLMLFLVRKGVDRIKHSLIPGEKTTEEESIGRDT